LMSRVMFHLYLLTRNLNSSQRKTYHQYIRPLGFILSFFAIFFWFFIWRIEFSTHESVWEKSVAEWFLCFQRYGTLGCGPHPNERLTTWVWYGFHVALALQGIILIITWGTQRENFSYWGNCIKKNFPFGTSTSNHSQSINSIKRLKTDPAERSSHAHSKNSKNERDGQSEIQMEAPPESPSREQLDTPPDSPSFNGIRQFELPPPVTSTEDVNTPT